MIKTEIYDAAKGIKRYWIGNNNGMSAAFIERGATITTINAPDKNGKYENALVELKNYEEYLNNVSFIGVVPGRYANRIGGAKFTIDGKTYNLAQNDNGNCLHGGNNGFDKKDWKVKEFKDGEKPTITFEYHSPDGEENFPGNLTATVTYALNNDNELEITYAAQTDKTTYVNLTQHAYFNLSGNYKKQKISDYSVEINANAITEITPDCVPTGKILNVENTVYDFRKAKVLNTIPDFYYDHNFVLNQKGDEMVIAARLVDPQSGRRLQVFTNYPGMQFYTGNWLDETLTEANGKKISRQSACCFETQFFPDSPNKPQFPNTLLKPGEKYLKKAIFKFDTI